MSIRSKGREIAFKVLYAIDVGKNSVADAFLPFKYESPLVLDYALNLVKGTLSELENIDSEISSLLKNWEFSRLNVVDKEILRVAFYEAERIEDSNLGVLVYESVELAKKYGDTNSGDFVNGLLRSFLRTKNEESET